VSVCASSRQIANRHVTSYYDNLSMKQCHGKKLPCSLNDTNVCVDQELADTVYRLGNWEYSYLWRDAPSSAMYSALHFGAWLIELKAHLQTKIDGSNPVRSFIP
jgi:acid phosphatase